MLLPPVRSRAKVEVVPIIGSLYYVVLLILSIVNLCVMLLAPVSTLPIPICLLSSRTHIRIYSPTTSIYPESGNIYHSNVS